MRINRVSARREGEDDQEDRECQWLFRGQAFCLAFILDDYWPCIRWGVANLILPPKQGRWKVQLAVIQLSASCNRERQMDSMLVLVAAGSFISSFAVAGPGSMSIAVFPEEISVEYINAFREGESAATDHSSGWPVERCGGYRNNSQ